MVAPDLLNLNTNVSQIGNQANGTVNGSVSNDLTSNIGFDPFAELGSVFQSGNSPIDGLTLSTGGNSNGLILDPNALSQVFSTPTLTSGSPYAIAYSGANGYYPNPYYSDPQDRTLNSDVANMILQMSQLPGGDGAVGAPPYPWPWFGSQPYGYGQMGVSGYGMSGYPTSYGSGQTSYTGYGAYSGYPMSTGSGSVYGYGQSGYSNYGSYSGYQMSYGAYNAYPQCQPMPPSCGCGCEGESGGGYYNPQGYQGMGMSMPMGSSVNYAC